MSYTYMNRRAAQKTAQRRAAPSTDSMKKESVPNSCHPGVMGGSMGTESLEQAMRDRMSARFAPPRTDKQAEESADHVGLRFSGGGGGDGVDNPRNRMGAFLSAGLSGTGGSPGAESLEQVMRNRVAARMGALYVNKRAEDEADRIGRRFSDAKGADDLRSRMGAAMGADFSGIRFHTGAEAAAKAATPDDSFASGRDIYLGGAFNPMIAAHEMVHTVQQGTVQASVPVVSAPAGAVQAWNPFKSIWNGIKKAGSWIGDKAKSAWGGIKKAGSWIGDKAKSAWGGIKKAGSWVGNQAKSVWKGIKKSHRKAVDAYNNNTEDFKKMGRLDRFKWAISNPLAWLRGGREESRKDTERRNAKKAWEDEQAAKLAGKWNADDMGDAADMEAAGGGDAGGGTGGGDAGGDAGGGDEEESALEKAQGINETIGDVTETIGDKAESISGEYGDMFGGKLGDVADTTKDVAGLANDISGAVGSGLDAADAYKKGDNLSMGRNIVNGVGDLTAVAGDIAGFAGADPVSGALGIASNAVKFGASVGSAAANQRTKSKLRDRQKRYEEETKGLSGKKLSEMTEEERYQRSRARAMGQGKRAASIRRNEDIFNAVGSGLKVAGGAAELAGGPAGAAVGTAAGILGTATEFIGGKVTKSQKQSLRKNTVNQEMDLDAKIDELQKTLKGPDGKPLSRSKAKHIILKSMGFKSGKRKEAFNKITENRAKMLTERANRGDAEEVGIMKDMFLSKRKNDKGVEEYNADTVADKLGKEEMADDNPFKKAADKVRKEEAKKAAKEAAKKKKK